MRTRMILAGLLASTLVTPVVAQEERRGGWRQERMERSQGDAGQREGWQRREVAPGVQQVQPQAAPAQQSQRQWSGRGGNNSGWQRPQEPAATPSNPQAPANGQWRGWQGRQPNGDVTVHRNWSGNNNANRNFGRDRDGVPNWRDRDNDGVRNNRDWDRNNDGRVDRRWDQNRNGVIDRRFDRNSDGVRDRNNWGYNNNWNREWRSDRRYDWQRYRYSNRDLFRGPRYAAPYGYGYGYQRYGIGIYLDSIFFGSNYWISDPWQYRLPPASWPYKWVRYYDDVLLIDTRSGYVVDAIYDFFW